MKKLALIISLFTLLIGCDKKQDGCSGPDRIIFREAKAAFLESGFILLDMSQDTTWSKNVPYWNCKSCSTLDFSRYTIQKDKGPITFNYQITCGIKYDEQGINYTNIPTLRIVIYSIKPL